MKNLSLFGQACFAALTNGYVRDFAQGKIYEGPLKLLCVPGLNCYSCPGAVGACPIGALQAVLGSRGRQFSFYAIGFLMAFGAFFGRFVCGWLYPFGLFQELLHKIPFPKNEKTAWRSFSSQYQIPASHLFCHSVSHISGESRWHWRSNLL